MNDLVLSGEEALFLVVRIGIIIFIFLYLVFAALVIKQTRLMTETLDVGYDVQIRVIAILHFAIAVTALVATLVII